MSITAAQECWAEALLIEKQHGSKAPQWIVDRVRALAFAGDEAGVRRSREIAACYDQLLETRTPS